ncbi:E3 ubiquitin-protein ligase RNFT1-like isoform X2 [Quercus lobata]|uniref:E3 ubiquitin-protein ligase RNFT1-like isoform X2 n=1 Tax=Quercus lobata TaxID=97700 RepID=UPI0012443FF2|nr:E3 ubiquitin-protein ligase RNFT1-like isoform X2 [Quercus lobata]
METSVTATANSSSSSSGNTSSSSESSGNGLRRFGFRVAVLNFVQSPLTSLFENSGLLGGRRSVIMSDSQETADQIEDEDEEEEELSIRIVGATESEAEYFMGHSEPEQSASDAGNGSPDDLTNSVRRSSSSSGSSSRYDIQQLAKWVEEILPYSLLLLVVFIRQHLKGFAVVISIAAVMFKSNDILKKQIALKEERKTSVVVSIALVFMLQVVLIYLWLRDTDLLYALVLLPPKAVPPFMHAIFIITVNDIMVRQAAMALKCMLLIYYKNCRGRDYRKQGQMLTLVEYTLLLYRALLPTPVWYRFFLNKGYGSIVSSLTTGLYLTLKFKSIIEKALRRKEMHYGSYATAEQVNAAGDLCAICQEKMHAPILLRCKHIFCEECVSEWFERERTCPLCRVLVKAADIKSYGDGSTTLSVQLF